MGVGDCLASLEDGVLVGAQAAACLVRLRFARGTSIFLGQLELFRSECRQRRFLISVLLQR